MKEEKICICKSSLIEYKKRRPSLKSGLQGGKAMLYIGLDCHKAFSYCTILNENGQIVFSRKIFHDEKLYAEIFLEKFPEEKIAVIEAGYNWSSVYEILTSLGIETKVGHPAGIKAIAAAKIKTDKRDSETLAYLLKADLIPEIYIPPKEIRNLKFVLRERLSLVKGRTRIKNKIHYLLVKNRVQPNGLSDIFGKVGRQYIDSLKLEKHSAFNLKNYLKNLDQKNLEIKEYDKYLKNIIKKDEYFELLKTVPGIGDIFASLLSLEIHDIKRFPNAKKFASYAGLVPSVYSSGQKRVTGHLMHSCNKYIRTALIEASWAAIRNSVYFKYHYIKLKNKKNANIAICGVARRMSEVIFKMLSEKRPYKEKIPKGMYSYEIK